MSRIVDAQHLEQTKWPGTDQSFMSVIELKSPAFAARLRRGGVGWDEWKRIMRPLEQAMAEWDMARATGADVQPKVTANLDFPPR